jgi:hypothetical protein
MQSKPDTEQPANEPEDLASRREFLRKSVYAAYATPLITALLVEPASAKQSGTGNGSYDSFCDRNPLHEKCN